jgi:hypothetical protein
MQIALNFKEITGKKKPWNTRAEIGAKREIQHTATARYNKAQHTKTGVPGWT